MNYSGQISFHSNNEPLLDLRIIDFIHYARVKCPNAKLFMYTNGTLLTEEKLKSLLTDLDFLVVDWYVDDIEKSDSKKINEWQKTIKKYNLQKKKLKIYIRKRNEILSTRGASCIIQI